MNQRELFFRHVAQTSTAPLALEIVKAEGSLLWDAEGREYIDMIAGISVCNVGHRHPRVVKAIRKQADQYLHLLVYGEFVETPQVQYAKAITDHLPGSLNSVYFTNSGAEAVEGAMKLAKRVTNRSQIIAFKDSYHGSTQGALSIIGDEYWRRAYRPLLPDVLHLEHGSFTAIEAITDRTACVIAEPIQAERGVYTPSKEWVKALRKKCTETGTLLILDEIQTGFGRTGTLWAFEQFNITPDVLLLGKALGGGMPLGAFIADKAIMMNLADNPVLGHITTFGGHPVCCAAGHAALKVLLKESLVQDVKKKEAILLEQLKHPLIKTIRSNGLMLAVEFDSFETNKKIIDACIRKGVLTDWFLFAANCMRLVPPLTISPKELKKACKVILAAMEEVMGVR
ncbi:aspartate aminotransferase family protein [Paraflavitalea sp. CAU 1676]|uniref:aspartate aminotransferase family protein n=1 Tax=Paraflavitalea sp. CAU 1676 TaxID=3032598 RepID=UPI0023DB3CFA|nr:aspartate aminotransferase family protein [Paraflavitalea sp. CAU 1676]MDF2193155.1 aspartate aminotransferase family protein [Paraflavitalea sp. CAU 1676]